MRCILSPHLCNLYSKEIFNELVDAEEGIIRNGKILTSTSEQLQSLNDSINDKWGPRVVKVRIAEYSLKVSHVTTI